MKIKIIGLAILLIAGSLWGIVQYKREKSEQYYVPYIGIVESNPEYLYKLETPISLERDKILVKDAVYYGDHLMIDLEFKEEIIKKPEEVSLMLNGWGLVSRRESYDKEEYISSLRKELQNMRNEKIEEPTLEIELLIGECRETLELTHIPVSKWSQLTGTHKKIDGYKVDIIPIEGYKHFGLSIEAEDVEEDKVKTIRLVGDENGLLSALNSNRTYELKDVPTKMEFQHTKDNLDSGKQREIREYKL